MANKILKTNESETNIQEQWGELVEMDASLDGLEVKLREETLALAEKFAALKAPLIEKRNRVAATIPRFWSTAFENHPLLGNILEDEDLDAFSYLKEIVIEDTEGNRKFIFKFNRNPYFENAELVKEIISEGEDVVEVVNQPIQWKSGKNLCEPAQQNGPKRKKADSSSFFTWFSDEDLEVADLIAEDLYPNAVKYFSGSNDNQDEGDEEDEEGDEEEEDDDEEDDDEEEDEEDGEEDKEDTNDGQEEDEEQKEEDTEDDE